MKKLLVFAMVLTLVFPAYCFASPSRAIVTKNKLPIDENLVNEVMLILEDGVIEQSEIESLLEPAQFEDACAYSKSLFWSAMFGAIAGIAFGGSWNLEVGIFLTIFLLNAYIICNVYGTE